MNELCGKQRPDAAGISDHPSVKKQLKAKLHVFHTLLYLM